MHMTLRVTLGRAAGKMGYSMWVRGTLRVRYKALTEVIWLIRAAHMGLQLAQISTVSIQLQDKLGKGRTCAGGIVDIIQYL